MGSHKIFVTKPTDESNGGPSDSLQALFVASRTGN
jgi:hypothetical protein